MIKLKQFDPKINIICAVSKIGSVQAIDSKSHLISLAETVFSKTVFKSYSSRWLAAPSLADAQRVASRFGSLAKMATVEAKLKNRPSLLPIAMLYALLIRTLDRILNWNIRTFNASELNDVSAILYDVYEETKDYNRNFLDQVSGVSRYSICHGINIDTDPIIYRGAMIRQPEKIIAYLFSDLERPYYTGTYGLQDTQLVTVGVPRHDDDWLDVMGAGANHESNAVLPQSYVLLISRSLSAYLTPERKRRAIGAIKRAVIDELGMPLVIKCHPKERNDGLYDEVLGSENLGVSWYLSNKHPFSLARRSSFAITFYSGVAADLVKLGVPVIEYLDLVGLEGYDNESALRDDKGEPIFSLRFHGLVRGVSNYENLKSEVEAVLSHRDDAVADLREQYSRKFAHIDDASKAVAMDILGMFN